MACSVSTLYLKVSRFFQQCFHKLGVFIGTYPVFLIILSTVVTLGLSVGMVTLTNEDDTETLYTPINSRASQDRSRYQSTFPDATPYNYRGYAITNAPMYTELIVSANDNNVFSGTSITEIRDHITRVKSISTEYDGGNLTYEDVCARQGGSCLVNGEALTTASANTQYLANAITYPIWNNVDISTFLGQVDSTGGKLVSAKYIALTFPLKTDTAQNVDKSQAWEEEFIRTAPSLVTQETSVDFAASHSLGVELNKNTRGDIAIFSVTFTLMITYATLVSGGDAVSSRTWASWAGVMAAGFGILSAFGLVSACGLKFVNIVGVMPFLIIGIGVDDMFLLMSSWADTYTYTDRTVASRIGMTFAGAGIGITITSVTDLLAFIIGASSVFVSVRNFCVYTGVAVIFCYLYQCFFFGPCLALHGQRVSNNRHCVSCLRASTREDLRSAGASTCRIYCCGGSQPTDRSQDERFFERIPRIGLPKILLTVYGKVTVLVLFSVYLGVSIWGVLNFKQGLELNNLVSKDSYFHSYSLKDTKYFKSGFPVPFVYGHATNYIDDSTVSNIYLLLSAAKSDSDMNENSEICWLTSYKESAAYANNTNTAFITGLKTFLTSATTFENDVVFDTTNTTIKASRCYIFSNKIDNSNKEAEAMVRMRQLADSSPLSVYVYFPAYIFFEQYISILPSTLQTIGVALAVITVVTFFFLPHPLLVLLVLLCIISILVGIFGFLHVWGLTLSTVTMIHLIMTVGFSVDFSVHVCTAYMLGEGRDRNTKTRAAVVHAAGPILNGGLSSFLGVIVLVFSRSYIFNSFFYIMFTVILFGMFHAVFILPVLLSTIGPVPNITTRDVVIETDRQVSCESVESREKEV